MDDILLAKSDADTLEKMFAEDFALFVIPNFSEKNTKRRLY